MFPECGQVFCWSQADLEKKKKNVEFKILFFCCLIYFFCLFFPFKTIGEKLGMCKLLQLKLQVGKRCWPALCQNLQ